MLKASVERDERGLWDPAHVLEHLLRGLHTCTVSSRTRELRSSSRTGRTTRPMPSPLIMPMRRPLRADSLSDCITILTCARSPVLVVVMMMTGNLLLSSRASTARGGGHGTDTGHVSWEQV